MTANELFSEKDLEGYIQKTIKSLVSLLSVIEQPSNSYEFDPSICNDIYTYIQTVQRDYQKANNSHNLFSNKDHTIKNAVYDNEIMSKSIQMVNNYEHNYVKMEKFEHEIDFHVDNVKNAILKTANIFNIYYKENSLLDEQTDNVYQKLNSQKNILNNEIDKFNNMDVNIKNAVNKWKESVKQKNDVNIFLVNEANKLLLKYQQKVFMVKTNIMNIVESVSKSLSMRAECLKFEIHIIHQGGAIFKMHRNINNLIETNAHKLNCYNDLQLKTENINKTINKDLDNIKRANNRIKNHIFNQTQRQSDVKRIVEEKFRQLCVLSNKLSVTEELLVNSREYLKNIEHKTKENQDEIIVKRQQIEDEKNKIESLKNYNDNKHKIVVETRHLIKEKQSQLKEIKSKHEKESEKLENKRLELQKTENNLKIMKSVTDHHERETVEKIQFYHDSVIRPLDLKLEKYVALVEYEQTRNNSLNYKVIEFSHGFEKTIAEAKSQIKQLDKTLGTQYGTLKTLEREFKNIQFDVISQLDVSTTKNEKFMSVFQAVIDYKTKMINNIEIKQKSALLECELFQRRYEAKRKREKLKEREHALTTQLDELKQLVRQQAMYNKELSEQYNRRTSK